MIEYPIIAKIQLIKVSKSGGSEFKYRLLKVYKGNLPSLNGTVRKKRTTSCDPELENRQKWIIFLREENQERFLGGCQPAFRIGRKDRKWERKVEELTSLLE